MIEPVLSAMRRLHRDKEFALMVPEAVPLNLTIEAGDLTEILSGLLDNAGKWARSRVELTVSTAPSGTVFTISDDGRGMTPEQIAQAFAIGVRFDPEKAGSGLGLAIARETALTMRAELTLESGASPLGGLTARLAFPAV